MSGDRLAGDVGEIFFQAPEESGPAAFPRAAQIFLRIAGIDVNAPLTVWDEYYHI
jgi:hypothetical protein